MTSRIRNGIGAVLSGSALALLYLNCAAWFDMPGKPAVWIVALGGAAGLTGALLMRLLDEPRESAKPTPVEPVVPGVPWQVNRLFLFNTLHHAAALTVADPERARTVIEKLAEYLRLVHELNHHPDTLLNLEIRCAGMFLALERMRFGDRLRVTEAVADDCLEYAVPSLM
ncbi:MAG TPA: histidine kinase, partial [bacterium]|nr:histidine kinase [bacterium]